jgi:hypothetical protein
MGGADAGFFFKIAAFGCMIVLFHFMYAAEAMPAPVHPAIKTINDTRLGQTGIDFAAASARTLACRPPGHSTGIVIH